MTRASTVALVGVAGGAGTTRLTVEFGATLARAGRDVALLDAAFGTQGLARHVGGTLDPDVTALVTDAETGLADGLVAHPADLPGRLAVCPAKAPFERLARAKTAEAARQFERLVAEADREFDAVLVDTPPLAANQAVAAVSAADRVAAVVPTGERGHDRLPTTRDRLQDVDASLDAVVANDPGGGGDGPPDADATVPESDRRRVASVPAAADPDPVFAPAVAAAVEACTGAGLGLSFPDEGLV